MSNSDGVEHLASVHDNPFIREYGIDNVITRHDPKVNVTRKASIDSLSTIDNESEQEYSVNSGFVNKLRSKFNQLQSESSHKVSLSRKSASLENLLDSSRDYSSTNYGLRNQKLKGNNGAKLHSVVQSSVELRKRATTPERPRSNEEESIKGNKPPIYKRKDTDFSSQNNFVKSSGKPPVSRKKPEPSTNKPSRNSTTDITKHKVEHHDWKVAPDLEKIGRDNIVIIESSSPCVKRKTENEPVKVDNEDKEDFRHVRPVRDKQTDENELPKPNTVSNFRSLFENTKKASDVVKVWRPQSPTRTAQGSSSPSVNSPRSPLIRMNDENVFESSFKSTTQKRENDKVHSPRNSSSTDVFAPTIKASPRNSSTDPSENVDTTSTSLQKSRDMFQKSMPESEKSTSVSRNRSSYTENDDNTSSPTSLSPRLAANTPAHPLSNIFDSSSVVKSDKPKRPKPIAVARKPHPPPKDTIELKHEADKKQQINVSKLEIKKSVDKVPKKLDIQTGSLSGSQSNDSNVTSPSSRNSGKMSPRKTKIFDSSNIIKKDKPSPRLSSSSPTFSRENSPISEMKLEEKTKKTESIKQDVSVSQNEEKVDINKTPSGVTTIVINNESTSKREPSKKANKAPMPMLPADDTLNERAKQRPKPADNKSTVSGMSSFLVNKMKKEQLDASNRTPALTNGSLPSPVPRKRQAPDIPMVNGSAKSNEIEKEAPPLPVSPEPVLPKTNIDDLMKRKKKPQTATKMVFDSSNIVKKKKEVPKRKPPRKTIDELNKNIMSEPTVPLLDLSSITNATPVTEYQEGYIPTQIKPCPFKFVGAEVTFAKSPYKKRKKARTSLKFDDTATTTFEYIDEETALEHYLQEHPEEREEVRKQEEEESEGVVPTHVSNDIINDTPMASESDSNSMKSNTVIGFSGGAFTNYKSKIQMPDFEFGVSQEPDVYMDDMYQDENPEDNMQLLPANENDLDAFSAETGKADLLF